ncbi:methionine ABC transporter substrate-binding protein [Tetragenococcus halophilus]|uniref:MetQ/NlpA family ABC transporter substrate-binding protein n=1 Tax=Tetragenococcus halophilus TaxID=51669 RepID=UPI001927190C|nr:MetQ/NlpA family ABC transporter substrate-binding protein [Tetragenococcus halophilus]MDN6569330.1 MetQ/NlpA family ABC transporter substrate-binding protein [Tetragenococcus halophilus]GEQ38622.1 methionine ABC transporter substrate-binding protein [Tetragenococcus halophilus]GEQ40891.1 methionine ABC transporter substrate-binding protein [Tetragenococcus halophilus]GEQ43126.1 methionine ABC transporter substrate-binding protein [Tetragenococcus halophilus]GEQ45413.1 methionine ABC transp
MRASLKKTLYAGVLGLTIFGLAACSSGNDEGSGSGDGDETLTVGASSTPHAEILEQTKDDLAEKGYELDVEVFDDYVLPNQALDEGDLDATFHQHEPYLDNFNEENGTDLVSAGEVHFEPLGLYPGKTETVDDLQDGAEIAIPNDATNGARALLLLEEAGLIKLDDDKGIEATTNDIEENPKDLEITELEASQIPRTVQDVDLSVINGNYAVDAGFDIANDSLEIEDKDSEAAQTYANIVAVQEGNEDDPAIEALMESLHSDDVKDFIDEEYQGAVVPLF